MVRNLYQGLGGKDVQAVQEALNLHPLGLKPLVPDGAFGPKTKAAVIAFQKRKNLVPDGIVGPLTLAALYPFGAYRLKVQVSNNAAAGTAPRKTEAAPALHPFKPLTVGHFTDLSSPLPMPLVPSDPSPTSQSISVKGGISTSIPLGQWPAPSKPTPTTTTLTLDWVGLIHTPRSFPGSTGIDLGMGIPISDGAKFTASASWAVTLAPDLFKFGRFDLLYFSAKAGVGVVGQNTSPSSYLNASGSLSLLMSYDLISDKPKEPAFMKLKVYLGGAFSGSLDHRDSKFHLTTSLPLTLGIQGSL